MGTMRDAFPSIEATAYEDKRKPVFGPFAAPFPNLQSGIDIMKNPLRLSKLSIALVMALAAASAFAQNTSSALGGHVVDANGLPVAGADVTITHISSGTVSHATTDSSGRYIARGLRVGGPYTVTVKKGDAADTESDVYLALDKEGEVDAQLQLAGATQDKANTLKAVEVIGKRNAAVFSPDNKGLDTNLSRRDLDNTPMPGRSIQDVARLDPRVNITDRNRGEISALGQNSRMNNISVDAVSVNDPFGLEANGLPYVGTPISEDSIQAYKISTANYDVTNRRSVGVNINAVTKSGTNDLHGSVYYAFKDANHLISDKPNPFKGYQRQWTSGLTLGGPIVKDKLFYFLSYEEGKTIAPGPDYGPVGANVTNQITGLSQADIDRIIQIATSKGLRPGSLAASSVNTDSKRLLAKIDWNINDAHRLSFRYNRVKETEPVLNGFSNHGIALSSFWYARNRDNKNYVLNLYDDWSDKFSTEASLAYTDYVVLRSGLNGDQPQVVINLGRNALGQYNNTNPYVDTGEDQFSHINQLGVKTWNGFVAGTFYAGKHTIKAGADFQQDKFFNLFGRTQFGAYTFNGIDNFANGVYRQFDLYRPAPGLTIDDVAARWTLKQFGFFAEDNWQATERLALQFGLRYDLPKTGDVPPLNACFASAPGVASPGCPKGGYGFANNTTIDGNGVWQPRASFNYSFGTKRPTQLRGGLGLFQANTLGVWLTNPYQNNGLTVATYSVRNPTDNPALSALFPFSADPNNQNVPPASSSQMVVDTLDPNFKQPTVWKSSLAIDHELPFWNTVISAEWQGIKVKDAIFYRNLNIGAPTATLPDGRMSFYCLNGNGSIGGTSNRNRCNANSTFGQTITVLDNTHKGDANFFTLALRKPFADNWSASVSATIGKATEVNPGTSSQASSNFSNNVWVNPNEDVASESNYSIRQRINASFSWQHKFFGNYSTSVSAFYDGHSGQPYSWTFGNDANGDSYSRDLVYIPHPGDVSFAAGTTQAQIDQFYNFIGSNAYLAGHQGTIANRNGTRAPWVNQLDLSFRQEVPGFGHGQKGELRLDVFNFLNALNKKWGQENRVGFPYNRTLANYAGVDANGHYIYSLPKDASGNYAPGQLITYDDNAISRWSVLVTLRYSF